MQVWPDDYLKTVDFRARCFVNGTVKNPRTGKDEPHSGHWSRAFRGHPWVEQSIDEGWGRDLRQHVIMAVKRRILQERPFHQVEELMPDPKWAESTRYHAARYMAAAKWREQVTAEHGSVEAYLRKTAKASVRSKAGLQSLGNFTDRMIGEPA